MREVLVFVLGLEVTFWFLGIQDFGSIVNIIGYG